MPKTADARRHWRLHRSWPTCDRERWLTGTSPAHALDIPGYGQELASESLATIERAYGRFLNWLDQQGLLDSEDCPEVRPTPGRIADYLRHLSELGYSGQTCLLLLSGLRSAMRILVPDNEWRWIVRPGGVSVLSRFRESSPRPPISSPTSSELYRWGLSVVGDASNRFSNTVDAAAFRDGLIIALLAARPVRIRTLAGLELDRHLVKMGNDLRLSLRSEDMKNKRALELPLPRSLCDTLAHYILGVRSQLSPVGDHKALWVGSDGKPMKKEAIGRMISRRAVAAFGFNLTPHRFRHAAATSAMVEDSETPGLAASLLAVGTVMIRKHCDRSDELVAIKRSHQALALERSRLEGVARISFSSIDRLEGLHATGLNSSD